MTKHATLVYEFVDFLPDKLAEGTLYICMGLATVAHKCCCGCGSEVVTPLSPTDWKLTYDGESVSLYPSIGNWGFACRSHYWIRNNRIKWARKWSREQVDAGRAHDRWAKDEYFGAAEAPLATAPKNKPRHSRRLWRKLTDWWK